MPEPRHPPYEEGSLVTPRELQRWLDINAQNGQLTRTQTFIRIPTFNVPFTWRGYSDIIATFNYESPNNFSLKNFSLPNVTDFYLAISYRTAEGVVQRYSLNSGVGEIFFFQTPIPYAGQLIKKNFRIEVWSTQPNVTPAVNTSEIVIYTSVRGSEDYRYATDASLVSADVVVTNFNNINTPVDLDTFGMSVWFTALRGVTGGYAWEDAEGVNTINSSGTIVLSSPETLVFNKGNTFFNIAGGSFTGAIVSQTENFTAMCFNLYDGNAAGNILTTNAGTVVHYDGIGVLTIQGQAINLNNLFNNYVVMIDHLNGVGYLYEFSNFQPYSGLVGKVTFAPDAGTVTSVTTHLLSAGARVSDIILSSVVPLSFDALYDYFLSSYVNSFSIPITFPQNSVSVLNS